MVEPLGPRSFSFDGRAHPRQDGASVVDHLLLQGLPTLQRSIRYHRPRAPFCGIGQCTGCLVRVNGRPNVRACRYVPSGGDSVVTENAWPSPRHDVLGALDWIFRGGIDTLHGFRRPAFLTPVFHRVIRRLAGYGAAPDPGAAAPGSARSDARSVDLVILGAGRSGRAAAEAVVAAGGRPLLLDRSAAATGPAGAETWPATSATFLPPPGPGADSPFELIAVREPAQGLRVRARRVIVATGSYDGALLFGSGDRPGVVTGDGALALDRPGARRWFRRAVLFGGGERARQMIERFGESIGALVAPGEIPPPVVAAANEAGIPLYPRTLLLQAIGRARVRGVEIAGRAGGAPSRLEADAVILAHRRLPHGQVLFQVGARMEWRGGPGAYFPTLDPTGQTSVPGLYAVGSVAAAVADASVESGRRAGASAIGTVAATDPVGRFAAEGPNEFEGYYRELLGRPRRGRWIVCPCEDVLLEEVEETHRAGYRGIEVVKRRAGVGTGLCQGRYCIPDSLLLLSIREGRPPSEVGYLTQRPPVFPTSIAALAALDAAPASEAV